MKKLQLLSTAAAVLLLTAGAASAQLIKKDEAPAGAPAAQRAAPAEKVAPPLRSGQLKAPETTGQAAPKEPELDKAKPGPAAKGIEPKGMEPKGAEPKGIEPHAAIKGKQDERNAADTHMMPPANKSAAEDKRTTTGQGAAAGAARLSTEQRTKIRTIFHQHRVASTRLNIAVRVGARLPETVHFYPVPVDVVDVYPEWRGYDYILVGDQILIVDPGTHEIVAVLDT